MSDSSPKENFDFDIFAKPPRPKIKIRTKIIVTVLGHDMSLADLISNEAIQTVQEINATAKQGKKNH
jgi:hypothetical protein